MSLKVYHQAGHNTVWNLQSFREDGVGDAIIIAPRYLDKEKVIAQFAQEPNTHVFDPQFFVPMYNRGKLVSYEFFPCNLANGFDTVDFQNNNATECANGCVGFQIENDYRCITIPCRFFEEAPSDFINKQESIYVKPFLTAIESHGSDKPVILQVVATIHMLKNENIFNELLTWITGIQNIDGVYLILRDARATKQIKDPDLLLAYLKFIHYLVDNELEVIVGYLNTEGILLSLASPTAITIGAYEAQRIFNPAKFGDPTEDGGGQPNARLYIPSIYQWLEFTYLGSLKEEVPEVYGSIPSNKYRALMFEPDYNWHFSKPELYKHYFLEFNNQVRTISDQSGKERYSFLLEDLKQADSYHRLISDRGVYLDPNNDGSHLPAWITAANRFAKFIGWR